VVEDAESELFGVMLMRKTLRVGDWEYWPASVSRDACGSSNMSGADARFEVA
jgi:hypothetical protein